MAHFVKVPKDLNDIKEKFLFGLTKRQVICFGIGLVLGAPVYYFVHKYYPDMALYAMGVVASPAIVCGLYRKNGIFFEKRIKYMIEFFKSNKKRYYRSTNIYQDIMRHIEYYRLNKKLSEAEGGKNGSVRK